jgi:Cytochrome P460
MKRSTYLLVAAVVLIGVSIYLSPRYRSAGSAAAPIFGIKIPPGFRDWKVISVAHEAGKNNDLRVVLGNDVAIRAWSYVPSAENNKVFGDDQSFVAGDPINVQFDVKDSRKYASTGGWGFAQFKDGEPADETVHATCFPCHALAETRDFVFTDYARTP